MSELVIRSMILKNKIILLLGLAIISLNLSAAELKIGVVSAAQVLERAPQAKEAQARIDEEFAPRNAKQVAEQKALKKLEEQLARDAAIMSGENRKKIERRIVTARRDLKRMQEEFMEDLNIRRNEELRRFQKLVKDTILTLAKEEDFDLILTEGVLYASKNTDITGLVIERLDGLNKAKDKK